jgi:hypothetical protein
VGRRLGRVVAGTVLAGVSRRVRPVLLAHLTVCLDVIERELGDGAGATTLRMHCMKCNICIDIHVCIYMHVNIIYVYIH